MKYFSILALTVLFIWSCCGTQQVIQDKSLENEDITIVTEVPDAVKTISSPDPTKSNLVESKNDSIHFIGEAVFLTSYNNWEKLLKKHVSENGKVDYLGFKKDKKELDNYIKSITEVITMVKWSKSQKLAYWINAYNALTIDLILRNYPTKSIKDIKDPWDQRLWKFGDKFMNLNDIEHEILRKMDEPRIHFAIVCASVSCPKLQNEAFTASSLDEQLTNATKEFLADTSKNELSKDDIKLSKIFKWFKKDFEQNGSLIDFLNQYSEIIISSEARKSFMDYNWDLND